MSTVRTFFLILLVLFVGHSVSVLAEPESRPTYEVEAVRASIPQAPFSIDGMEWRCQGNRCLSRGSSPIPPLAVCLSISEVIGEVKSFHYHEQVLSPADLARCNGLPLPVEEPALAEIDEPSVPGDNEPASGISDAATDVAAPTETGVPENEASVTQGPPTEESDIKSVARESSEKGQAPPASFTPLRIRTGKIHIIGMRQRNGS